MSTNNMFWAGFIKRAEAYVAPSPDVAGESERALLWNEQGGVDPRSPEDQQAAAAVNLVTLPIEVEGASCLNCMHFRQLDQDLGAGFCTNPQLKQDVTSRMVCSVWEHPGSHNPAELTAQAAEAQQTQGMPMSEEIMQDVSQPPMAEGGQEGALPAEAGQDGPPPAEAAPAPDKKKDSPGHTVNINVGSKKTAASIKEAFNIHMALKRLGKRKKGTSVASFMSKRR